MGCVDSGCLTGTGFCGMTGHKVTGMIEPTLSLLQALLGSCMPGACFLLG